MAFHNQVIACVVAICFLYGQVTCQTLGKPAGATLGKPAGQSRGQLLGRPMNQPRNQPVSQPMGQPIRQSTNQVQTSGKIYQMCKDKVIDSKLSKFTVISPGVNGPQGYPNNIQCSMYYAQADYPRVIRVTFPAFDLQSDPQCRQDSLSINQASLCGNWPEATKQSLDFVVSAGQGFKLAFTTDRSLRRRGFVLNASVMPYRLGQRVFVYTGRGNAFRQSFAETTCPCAGRNSVAQNQAKMGNTQNYFNLVPQFGNKNLMTTKQSCICASKPSSGYNKYNILGTTNRNAASPSQSKVLYRYFSPFWNKQAGTKRPVYGGSKTPNLPVPGSSQNQLKTILQKSGLFSRQNQTNPRQGFLNNMIPSVIRNMVSSRVSTTGNQTPFTSQRNTVASVPSILSGMQTGQGIASKIAQAGMPVVRNIMSKFAQMMIMRKLMGSGKGNAAENKEAEQQTAVGGARGGNGLQFQAAQDSSDVDLVTGTPFANYFGNNGNGPKFGSVGNTIATYGNLANSLRGRPQTIQLQPNPQMSQNTARVQLLRNQEQNRNMQLAAMQQQMAARRQNMARQQEIARQQNIARQQEIARQQNIARQQEIARQQNIAIQQNIARQQNMFRNQQIAQQTRAQNQPIMQNVRQSSYFQGPQSQQNTYSQAQQAAQMTAPRQNFQGNAQFPQNQRFNQVNQPQIPRYGSFNQFSRYMRTGRPDFSQNDNFNGYNPQDMQNGPPERFSQYDNGFNQYSRNGPSQFQQYQNFQQFQTTTPAGEGEGVAGGMGGDDDK